METLFFKGVSFGFMAKRNYYRSEAGQREIDRICELKPDAVALIVTMTQESYQSTKMVCDFYYSPDDVELTEAIQKFHAHGIRVMLKPMIECLDSIWRGKIEFPAPQRMIEGIDVDYWGVWFRNYTIAITHYARLAERTNVELFCIGCELMGCEPQENYWPAVVAEVRKAYSGPITYNANQYVRGLPFARKWYRLLDMLGVSFYTGTQIANPTVDELSADLEIGADILEDVVKETGIPLFFAECGARSVEGGLLQPWDYLLDNEYNGEVQALYLEAVIQTFGRRPWWRGLMWWKWEEQQNRPFHHKKGGNTGFTLYGKPAMQVMKNWCQK